MHASQARLRRHDRLNDDEPYGVARAAERRPVSYGRSQHHSSRIDPYGGSSAPQRSYAEPSHSRRSDDWRVAESAYASTAHDRYRDEVALPTRRDDYYNRAEGWSNRRSQHSQYPSSRRQWGKRDDRGYAHTSYTDSRQWTRNVRYDERSRGTNGNEGWYQDDVDLERDREIYSREEVYPPSEHDLRTRDDVVTIEPARGRESPVWTEQADDHTQWREVEREGEHVDNRDHDFVQDSDRTLQDVDRKWEPAPSWKSRERSDRAPTAYERSNYLPPSSHSGKRWTKNKKKNQQVHNKRDIRRDDNMNNWQKREFIPAQRYKDVGKSSGGKQRQEYYPRSRSRSPARSNISRHSSNRSRSRSISAKRRRRVDESLERSDIASGKRGYDRRSHSPRIWPSTKSRSDENRDRIRQTSVSSRSSRSRSRSRSSSEPSDDKPKPKHRLPLATSIRDIEIKAKTLRLSSNLQNGPPAKTLVKPEAQVSTSSTEKPPGPDGTREYRDEYDTMPPPIIPASASVSNSTNGMTSSVYPTTTSTVVVDTQHRPARRNAVFRPIGTVQASSAIKRFFPGDDDEESNTMQEDHQEKQETTQLLRRSESIDDGHQRQGSATPSSARSDRDMEARAQYDSRGHFVPARNGQPVERNDATKVRREDQRDAQDTSYRRHRAYETESVPPTPSRRQAHPSAVNGDAHVDGRTSREHSRPPNRRSDLLDRTEARPSPAQMQIEDAAVTDQALEVPKDQLYAIVSQVGEGTFGKVYKARNTVTGAHVALKRIRMETERDGFPVTAMREIKLLQSLRHINIVQLMEMMVHHGSVYMVFEYMDHDLTGVLSQTQFSFTAAHLKSLCQQMLQGLSYLHRKGVIHRDIKGSNILLNNRGELKLADFGLARFYQKRRRADYTNRVITLWYRPPELLLGTTVYGPEVDMWSAGCIMLELFCKKQVFQGNDEIHQLDVIYKILGTPTPEEWPGVTNMPWYELVKPRETIRNRFRQLFNKWLSPAALDLAERLLTYDPQKRVTADQALAAAYFSQEEPPPAMPIGLATLEGEWHEFESKRERAKKRRRIEAATGSVDPASVPLQ